MNRVLEIFLSLSFSGSLIILLLFLAKPFWKDKISRQWQYYIWLVVLLRLLLPFGPESNLSGKTYRAVDQALVQASFLSESRGRMQDAKSGFDPAGAPERDAEYADNPAKASSAVSSLRDMASLLANYAWLIWIMVSLGMLIRKITIYQGFVRYIRAGMVPVSDMEMLDKLALAAKDAGVERPVELCCNPLISSPSLIGLYRPCIVLPQADIPEKNFPYVALHELTHYKRRDLLYKWLVQLTVCLHWFNPLVHLMSREIMRACEFSCDEAVLVKTGCGKAQDYGQTLLDAMAAVGKYKESYGAVTLSENKQLLKERLGAIMGFGKKSKGNRFLTGIFTLCIVCGALFAGGYPAQAASARAIGRPQGLEGSDKEVSSEQGEGDGNREGYSSWAEKSYEAGSLPLFQLAFFELEEQEQEEWLERIYADSDLAFFGAVVNRLDEDCDLIMRLAEKSYGDNNVSFFSTLANNMSGDVLEAWLERALADENFVFQSTLFHALDRDEEWDGRKEQQKEEWEKKQTEQYRAAGVTMDVTLDGKNYYYQGQLIHIFLDIRANQSFYTLDVNPAGTVNVKIIRNADDEITGAAYMTEEEVTGLFGEEDLDEDPD